MSLLKLARVRFYLGQTLLPEHLQAQEDALLATQVLRARGAGLPAYGLIELGLSEPLLRSGVFGVTDLSAVLPSGQLLDVPALCSVAPLSLTATGATRLSVFLHVLSPHHESAENRVYAADPPVVERVLFRAALSITDSIEGSVQVLKLAEVEKTAEGAWRIDPSYVPPLLSVGVTTFLLPELREIERRIGTLEPQLVPQLQDSFLRPERLSVIRRCVVGLRRTRAMLADIDRKVTPHPYQLFSTLRELYGELCCFHEVLPDEDVLGYRHDALGPSFGRLFAVLHQHLRPVYAHTTHRKFDKANGLFVIGNLSEDTKLAEEVYLLIQRSHVHKKVPMDDVKLSATSRLALIHRLILKGVQYKPVERPTFQHPFGAEVDFYQLIPGEEWNHCLKEGSVAFYVHPALESANAYLFWR